MNSITLFNLKRTREKKYVSWKNIKYDSIFVRSDSVANLDYEESRFIKRIIYNSEVFSGLIKSNDSLYFIDKGQVELISTIYDNGQEKETFEVKEKRKEVGTTVMIKMDVCLLKDII